MARQKVSTGDRDRSVQVTLNENEEELIGWAADALGLSKASYLRMTALRDARVVTS